MDYAQQQRNPAKHIVGFTVVVLLHVLIVWFIMNGLARKVIDVIKKPLETQIIEEVKPPPPPPPVQLPPPPKFVTPPPPYIPPPEVQVNVPPPPNAIATVTSVVPVAPPPPIAAVSAPPAPPAPAAPQSAKQACTNYARVMDDRAYPRDAIKQGIEKGEATIRFTVGPAGEIKDIVAVSSTNRIFARAASAVVAEFKCVGQGRDIPFELTFGYKLE